MTYEHVPHEHSPIVGKDHLSLCGAYGIYTASVQALHIAAERLPEGQMKQELFAALTELEQTWGMSDDAQRRERIGQLKAILAENSESDTVS